MTEREKTTGAASADLVTTFRYLVSVVVAGLVLGLALSTQLNAIIVAAALPLSIAAAVVAGLPIALFMRHKGWRRFSHVVVVGALLGLVPWGLLEGLTSLQGLFWNVALGVGVAITAWLALKVQTVPLRFLPPRVSTPATGVLAATALALGVAATYGGMFLIHGPPASPESRETVAAFEIPLPSEHDRSQFLNLLRHEAEAEGLHVDAADNNELQQTARAIPEAAATISAAVWRGQKDNRLEASVTDMSHVGFAWITFSRGEDPEVAKRFRDRAMRKITERWPHTRALPIMPTGAIPLRADLEATSDGYRVKASAASRYEPSAGTPSLAPEGVSIVR